MRDHRESRPTAACDTECYVNYWSIAFRDMESERVRLFELYEGHPLDRSAISKILRNWRIVTFNGMNYDLPMIALAMSGATNGELKRASDDIIMSNLRSWEARNRYGELPDFVDHIDLMEVSPGAPQKPSLKLSGGRLHTKRMQDLPFEPDSYIGAEQRTVLRSYLGNDLDITRDMFIELTPQIELRASMSMEYGVDLRSKSDAQMAEAVIRAMLRRLTRKYYEKPEVKSETFQYRAPSYISFQTEQMQRLLSETQNAQFAVDPVGTVSGPPVLEKALVVMGSSTYKVGIGGLHSQEAGVSHWADDENVIIDSDVASYYPLIILGSQLAPAHLGNDFLTVYRQIVDRRLQAKENAKKAKKDGDVAAERHWADIAESLKITINGSFGKFGNCYSLLYSPKLMIQVTMTGQFAVLMLIEQFEMHGIPVISANTDGFVAKCPVEKRDLLFALRWDWEAETGFMTEETEYRSLHSRGINSYIAIPLEGKPKRKGDYTVGGPGQKGASGLKKNPSAEISADAVVAYLKDGVPIEKTILACDDIRKFVSIRKVVGGAERDGEYIGKSVRWYYATGNPGRITYCMSGNNVPKSEGAKPCMELPDQLPDDIDYDWYIREAYAVLQDVGAGWIDPALVGRTGRVLARLPEQKNIHTLDLSTGAALCGAKPASLRERWVEYEKAPDGHRLCSKCRKAD